MQRGPSKRRRGNSNTSYSSSPYGDPYHDPYFWKKKPKNPTQCLECSVVFDGQCFRWENITNDTLEELLCPACERIKDNYTGGVIEIKGAFLQQHREEISNLIYNVEQKEKALRPLQRIMETSSDSEGSILLTTTYEHIARSIGNALKNAYNGKLDIQYVAAEKLVRIHWSRD